MLEMHLDKTKFLCGRPITNHVTVISSSMNDTSLSLIHEIILPSDSHFHKSEQHGFTLKTGIRTIKSPSKCGSFLIHCKLVYTSGSECTAARSSSRPVGINAAY